MQNTIERLVGQALDRAVPETWTQMTPEQVQRFARELAMAVAAEAVEVVQARFMGDLNREDQEVRRCAADLERHFGLPTATVAE